MLLESPWKVCRWQSVICWVGLRVTILIMTCDQNPSLANPNQDKHGAVSTAPVCTGCSQNGHIPNQLIELPPNQQALVWCFPIILLVRRGLRDQLQDTWSICSYLATHVVSYTTIMLHPLLESPILGGCFQSSPNVTSPWHSCLCWWCGIRRCRSGSILNFNSGTDQCIALLFLMCITTGEGNIASTVSDTSDVTAIVAMPPNPGCVSLLRAPVANLSPISNHQPWVGFNTNLDHYQPFWTIVSHFIVDREHKVSVV